MTFLDTFSMSPETAALVAAINRLEHQLALALNPDTHPDLLHFRRR